MKDFDGLDYTRESLLEELSLMERHARDGSAVEAGCSCIEEKHLLLIAGLASEGVTLAKDQAEKEFYMNLADRARELRQQIIQGDWKKADGAHGLSACERKIHKCLEQGGKECTAEVLCH